MRGRVESLSNGAHGIVRSDGKVYFVRATAPGDEIEFEVREEHRSYAFAEMTALLAAGPARRQPPCEYLPRCGGCPWQHVDYAAQLAAKERSVAELLRRVAGLTAPRVLPILGSPHELGYRRRLSLRVENRRLGYFAAASHDLVPVRHCLLAEPALEGAIERAQGWIDVIATRVKRIEIAAAAGGTGAVFAAQAEGAFAAADGAATEAFLAGAAGIAGIVLRGRGWRRAWGAERIVLAGGDGEAIEVPAGGFAQVNAAANLAMVGTVLDFAAATAADRVLDLYAGFGNLTFPLARVAGAVTAVERDAAAVEAGARHARARGLGHVSFVRADVAAFLDAPRRGDERPTLAVLDPPRSGAAEAIEPLLRLAPPRLVYVSCNPATLARDLALLARRYTVGRVQPIDFFPQSPHVETVVELRLTETEPLPMVAPFGSGEPPPEE